MIVRTRMLLQNRVANREAQREASYKHKKHKLL